MSPWIPRVLIVLIVLGVGGAIYSIAVGDGGPQSIELEGRVEVQKLIAGIPQDAERLGPDEAPVEIELFTDVRAIPAATFQAEVVNPIIITYVREGQAQIDMRHFSFGRSGVTEAAIASVAAGEQGHQWQYAELVLRNLDEAGPQGIDEEFLNRIAEVTPGLLKDEWDEVFDSELEAQASDEDYESVIDTDGETANDLRLPVGPAIVVTGIGGSETLDSADSAPTLEEVEAAITRVSSPPPAP